MSVSVEAREAQRAARAFWVTSAEVGEIRPVDLEEPNPKQALVRTLYSAVSRGTEALVFRGQVPTIEYARMQAPHQEGAFSFPVKYGYSCVGRVLTGPKAGATVFCLHPHQTAFCVDEADLVEVPEFVPAGRAVLAANMETALNGIWDARLSLGDRVVVVGAGVVGCLIARLVTKTPGCRVQLLDLRPSRGRVAAALGASFCHPESEAAWTDVDRVFEASGSSSGLQTAIDVAGRESAIVHMSWLGMETTELRLGTSFHSQRQRIIASQVSTVPSHQIPRWTRRRRIELALGLLDDPALDALFGDDSPFDTLPEVMATLVNSSSDVVCPRIRYS